MLHKLSSSTSSHNAGLRLFKGYLNSGDLIRARDVLDKTPKPDLRSLTILLSSYTKQGLPDESIRLYRRLRAEDRVMPDKLILLSVAQACARSGNIGHAKDVHQEVVNLGFNGDLLLGNALVDMYGKCGCSEGARRVFDGLPEKDVISWTSLISAYVNCKSPKEGLWLVREMVRSGVWPNSVTLSAVLPVCSELKLLGVGASMHCFAIKRGLEDDVFVCSGLMDMYAGCGSIKQARIIFDSMGEKDSVSSLVILTAHLSAGEHEEAMALFDSMRCQGVPMSITLWNCMIGGLAQNGRAEQAFKMFAQMQWLGFKPNKVTVVSILPACINIESLRAGKEVNGYAARHLFVVDAAVMTSVLFMYAKCGALDKARHVFDQMPRKDIVAWNTMILANSMYGCGEEALSLYNRMLSAGMKPNSHTFMGVLSACSHSHLAHEGRSVFDSMSRDHGLVPDAEHYACMVDVLSRAGHLDEAHELILSMPMEPTASAWGALLAACRVYKNVELGKIAANRLFEIEPENPGNYVQLSNMLVTAKMWDDASKIRILMRDKLRDRGVTKSPGCSWIQVKNKVYTFVRADDKNVQRDEIYAFLKEMGKKMKREGYLPDTNFVLQDVDREEEKEEILCGHSEKLAVAFGILNSRGERVVRVFKNLRTCGDCHNAIKFIAKITAVEIIVRDNVRFHHFTAGSCSCRDRW